MKRNSLLEYLKSKWVDCVCFVGIFVILLSILFLYNMPLEAIGYGLLLCLIFVFILSGLDYLKYGKKVRNLELMVGLSHISGIQLPESSDYMEILYQEMVHMLELQNRKLLSESENRYIDMLDYYTMWAHQIKTPLSAIKLLVQVNEGGDKEFLVELFKIEQYVEMVLQYLRMEEMSKDLVIERHSLEGLVKQAVRKYATLFIHKKVSIDIGEIEDSILTDEKWFVFVLEQLLSNGIKYNKMGGSIKIYLHKEKESTIVIEDTGIGIIEEDIYRVFERGFTGLNGRFDKKSTGIGLYLCRNICKKLSHSIEIESKIGVGTKVIINYAVRRLEVE